MSLRNIARVTLVLSLVLSSIPLIAQDFDVGTVLEEVPLREKPGYVYKESGRLLPGEQVIVDQVQGEWAHIAHMGWVPVRAIKLGAKGPRFKITVDTARLRAEPNTGAAIVGTARKGEIFDLLEEREGWAKVGEGKWVFMTLGKKVESGPNLPNPRPDRPAPAGEGRDVAVLPSKVNLRAGPGTNHPVVGSVTQGEMLTVTETAGDWLKTARGGWIRNDLVGAAAQRPESKGVELPQWGLLSLLGVYIKVVAVPPGSAVAVRTDNSLDLLTGQDRDYTFLSVLIDVPARTTYRFNYSPAHNRVQVTDKSGRRFGNYIQKEGDLDKLPAEVRALFQGQMVFPGNSHQGILAFSGDLDPNQIEKIEIFMSGSMHQLYQER